MKDKQLIAVTAGYHRSLISNPNENAYGSILSWDAEEKRFSPVICGHGGSMYLCFPCAEKLKKQI